jgi:hypothetical protein
MIVQIYIENVVDFILSKPVGRESYFYLDKSPSELEYNNLLQEMEKHHGPNRLDIGDLHNAKNWRAYPFHEGRYVFFRRNTAVNVQVVIDLDYDIEPLAQYIDLLFSTSRSTILHKQKSVCPVCGKHGDILFVQFYCSNKKCQNFHL